MTLVDEVQPRDANERTVLGYFRHMKRKQWDEFGELWNDDAVQQAFFRPDGLDNFIPERFVGREPILAHYRKAIANRREHEFWIDVLHRTEDPDIFVVECRGRSVVGENDRVYENRYVFIFELRDGRIAYLKEYADPLPVMRAFSGAFD
ncbi:nuclear transport factor 2 family protein [Arthrobacter sp. B0490]|uniref:nuclear transport factor 2 family protein n=1 Tax=Arthrobacter sp. B0490 TaxID=2058891 RepID=UPI0015E3FD3A|nr:nuclear transport factor 2 family protein [Arthrobacter sp. B0490]